MAAVPSETAFPTEDIPPTVEPTGTNTPTLTPGPISLPTATSTFTPVPTATPIAESGLTLSKHTFEAGPVLFQLNGNACVDVCSQRFSALPNIILYSDGKLITLKRDGISSKLFYRRLSIPQMCQILNTFDAIGFHTFDQETFSKELEGVYFGLSPLTTIELNAWEETSRTFRNFREFGTDTELAISNDFDTFLKSLYGLLNDTDWGTTESYPPEKTIMSIMKVDDSFSPAFFVEDRGEWDSYNFTLSGAYENSVETKDDFPDRWRVVDGNMSIFFHNFSDQEANPFPFFLTENGQRYRIETRPMLPFESIQSVQTSYGLIDIIPAPDIEFDSSKNFLTCLPEHGVLDIYNQLPISNE